MRSLFVAALVEGISDQWFFEPLLPRLLESYQYREVVEIPKPEFVVKQLSTQFGTLPERVRETAQRFTHSDILLIHLDADAPGEDSARTDRFDPCLDLVQACPADSVCRSLVPIIPIRMTEAWLFADHDALRKALNLGPQVDLDSISDTPEQVEAIQNPKSQLKALARRGLGPRRKADWERIRNQVGAGASLASLRQVPAFARFDNRLLEELRFAGYLE